MLGEPLKTKIVEDSFIVLAPVELYLRTRRRSRCDWLARKAQNRSSLTKEAAKLFVRDFNAL